MIVYADVLFFINFISSYVMLYLIGKLIVKSKPKKWRLIIASAVGGMAAVVIFSRGIPVYVTYLIRASSAVIMVFISFYEQKQLFLRHICWLFAVSVIMTGTLAVCAAVVSQSGVIAARAGTVYFDLPLRIFLPMFILSYAGVAAFMKLSEKRRTKQRYIMTVTIGGRKMDFTALFDSGNLLREPISGKSVSIVEWDSARKLFGESKDVCDIYEMTDGALLRVVPFHTVAAGSGTMLAFMADSIELKDENRIIENTFIGLYEGRLSENNEYNALLNSALL